MSDFGQGRVQDGRTSVHLWKRCKVRVVAIVHEAEEGGFWAEVPALPGCYTQAESLDELKVNLKEVVELLMETSPGDIELQGGGHLLELAI